MEMMPITFWLEVSHRSQPYSKGGDYTRSQILEVESVVAILEVPHTSDDWLDIFTVHVAPLASNEVTGCI